MAVTETVKIVFEVDNKAITDTVGDLAQVGKVAQDDAAKFKQLGEASKQASKDMDGLAKSTKAVTDSGKEVGKNAEGFVSLRTRVREAKEEVQRLSEEFGEFSTEANAARQRAGLLADEMSDLNRQVNLLNPESKIKAFSTLGAGVVGAFQVATGALQAFGAENEEVQKIAQKLQGALNVVQGVQSIVQLKEAYKDVQVVLGFTSAAQQSLNVAQVEGAAASGAAAGGIRTLTAAIAANPIGALAVAIGLVAGAFLLLGDAEEDEAAKTKKNKDAHDALVETLNKEADLIQQRIEASGKGVAGAQREVELIKARGIEGRKLYEAEQKVRQEELAAFTRRIGFLGDEIGGEKEKLALKIQVENKKNEIEAARIEFQRGLNEKSLQEFKKSEDNKLKALQAAQNEREKIAQNQSALQSQFENELSNQISNIDKKTNLEKLRNANQYFNNEKELKLANLASDISNLDQRLLKLKEFGKEGTDEYEQALAERELKLKEFGKSEIDITSNTEKAKTDITKESEEERLKLQQKRIEETFSIAQGVIDLTNTIREAEQQAEIESLEKRKEAGLITEEEYQKQLKKLKQKAAEDDKKAQIFQATMSAAQAILTALTVQPATAIPAAVAFASVISALNLAKVIATPIPKFNKGTLSVPGIDTGGDSVYAMLRPGEAVIPTDTNRAYAPSIKAIYQKQIKPSDINAFVLNKLSGKGSIGRDTAITASVDTFALSKALSKNKTVEVGNASVVGRVIANEILKAYNPRR